MEKSVDLTTFLLRLQHWLRALVIDAQATQDILSEYQILRACMAPPHDFFAAECLHQPLELFRAHFCLFHCLYRLRQEFLDEGCGVLEISALRIALLPPAPEPPDTSLSAQSDTSASHNDETLDNPGHGLPSACADPLTPYYLDLDNLRQTGAEDVQRMLDSFWQRLTQPSTRQDALKTLGCHEDASPAAVKKAYRRMAARHHPDRGGKQSDFIAIRKAYEAL